MNLKKPQSLYRPGNTSLHMDNLLKADEYIYLSQHIHAIKIKLLYGYRETKVGSNKISPKALDKGKLLDKKITLECLKSMC